MFLSLSCLDNLFLSFLNLYIYGFCKIWEVFSYCFFGFFFLSPPSFSSPCGTLMTWIFNLFYNTRLGNFYCSVFQFTDSFPWTHHSAIKPIHWGFWVFFFFFEVGLAIMFLFLGMMSGILLNHGHFQYYVMRLWSYWSLF